MKNIFSLYLVANMLWGCSTFQSLKEESDTKSPEEGATSVVYEEKLVEAPAPKTAPKKAHLGQRLQEEFEVKLAQMWLKIDALEDQIREQSQRIQKLEGEKISSQTPDVPKTETIASEELDQMGQELERRWNIIQDELSKENWNKSITEVNDLLRDFPEKSLEKGAPLVLSKAWSKLGNLQNARLSLVKFLKESRSEKWAAQARYELARIYLKMGFEDQARQNFRDVLSLYPKSEYAEKSKLELKLMRERF